MFLLILAVVLGLVFTFLATQNTGGITLRVADLVWPNIPLYAVILGSLLVGLALSWIMSFFGWAASARTLSRKDTLLRNREHERSELRERLHELEAENTRLRGESREEDPSHAGKVDHGEYDNIGDAGNRPTLLDRLRHGLSF